MESIIGATKSECEDRRKETKVNIKKKNHQPEQIVRKTRLVSSSGEDSEDSISDRHPQRSDKKDSGNWSPKAAIHKIDSFRRKKREKAYREDSRTNLKASKTGIALVSVVPKKAFDAIDNKNCSSTAVAGPVAPNPTSPPPCDLQQDEVPSSQEENSVSTPSSKNDACNSSDCIILPTTVNKKLPELPTTDKVEVKTEPNNSNSTIFEKVDLPIKEKFVPKKKDSKLPISAKRFNENTKKSHSKSGMSPVSLKKAFQFTRSYSWSQKKLAAAASPPPAVQKPKVETSSPKYSPVGSPRQASLSRGMSLESPQNPSKTELLKELQSESQETPEEEEGDNDSLPRSASQDEEEATCPFKFQKPKGIVQQERSQDLDSPSNAALPIVEVPSVPVCKAGWVLRTLILMKAPHLLQDRRVGHSTVARCAIGAEMTEWLMSLSNSVQSRAHAAAMWQVLLEEGALLHSTNEQPFRDKFLFYRFLDDVSVDVGEPLPTPSSQERKDAEDRLTSILAFLSQRAPDATIRYILRKPSHERTLEDQELIYEELLHLTALSHLSNSVKRELASVIKFESHTREGTILFEQGWEGKSWFIIIRGAVDVVINGKGVVTTLQEGDDFGKLALVNDAPRAATIVLKEDNCQFLRVDKGDFNRILRDVEAKTVPLKEHGKDVLILEKVSTSHPQSHYKYTVMAGTPQKMLEHLLQTRLDSTKIGSTDTLTMGVGVAVGMGLAMGASMSGGESSLPIRRCDFAATDFFLDDFLLTHIIFMPYDLLVSELAEHYRMSGSTCDDQNTLVACKKRVVRFVHRWVMTISDPIFANESASEFIRTLKTEVESDYESYGSSLREESSLMFSTLESLERYEQEVSTNGISKWKLPTSGRPISLFGSASLEDSEGFHRKMHAHDEMIFRVYCADHTYCTLRFPLTVTGETIKKSAADKLGLNLESPLLVELKSNREVVVIGDQEVCVPTRLTINGRLFVAHRDHLDALIPLNDQSGPDEGTHAQLEMFSTKELAYHISSYDWDLFTLIHEYEFLYQVFGRDHFRQAMCNLDLFLRRFNELQFWVVTEICLANTLSKRTQLLRKFIKLAAYCKEQQNLNAFFAIVMGLSNVVIVRLTQTWERLSSRFRKMFIEFEMLIDPSRNHRAYRIYVAKLHPPIIPFTPLLMKDMTFTHDGNRTYVGELVNFEKMHMLAQTLRTVRYCRSKNLVLDPPTVQKNENEIRLYVRSLHVIDNQKRLLSLSQRHEPKRP